MGIQIIDNTQQASQGIYIQSQSGITDYAPIINNQITKLATAGTGGSITLGEGIFTIASPIQLRSNIVIQGQNSATKIKIKSSSNCNAIQFSSVENIVQNAVIRNLVIDGNRRDPWYPDANPTGNTSGDGISLYQKQIPGFSSNVEQNPVLENLHIINCAENGLLVSGYGYDPAANNNFNIKGVRINNVRTEFCNVGAYFVATSDSFVFRLHATNCEFQGIFFDGAGNVYLTESKTIYNGRQDNFYRTAGIRIKNSKRCHLNACEPQEEYQNGILLEGCRDVILNGCRVDSNGRPPNWVGNSFNNGNYTYLRGIGLIIDNCFEILATGLSGADFNYNDTDINTCWQNYAIKIKGGKNIKVDAIVGQHFLGTHLIDSASPPINYLLNINNFN